VSPVSSSHTLCLVAQPPSLPDGAFSLDSRNEKRELSNQPAFFCGAASRLNVLCTAYTARPELCNSAGSCSTS
jgi:hypothetical protein